MMDDIDLDREITQRMKFRTPPMSKPVPFWRGEVFALALVCAAITVALAI